MNDILDSYGQLLTEVDDWFARCLSRHRQQILCREGCSACCRGLFDITLLDALYLKRGIHSLENRLTEELQARALERLQAIARKFSFFKEPWLLNSLSDDEQGAMMPEDDQTPCLLLAENGSCLAYNNRPMTCRLNGIPLFEIDGEPFSDEWCTRNFVDVDPGQITDIRYRFMELFYQEQLLFRELTRRIYGAPLNELDTIIPGAVLLTIP